MQPCNIEVEAMREIPTKDSDADLTIRKMLESPDIDGFVVLFATGKAMRGYTCSRNIDPEKGSLVFPVADERLALQFLAAHAQGSFHAWSFPYEGAAGSGMVTTAGNPVLAVLKRRRESSDGPVLFVAASDPPGYREGG